MFHSSLHAPAIKLLIRPSEQMLRFISTNVIIVPYLHSLYISYVKTVITLYRILIDNKQTFVFKFFIVFNFPVQVQYTHLNNEKQIYNL